MENIEALLQGVVHDHLQKYYYDNFSLFSEGCKPCAERKISSIDAVPPHYCYQHNEHLVKALLAAGIDSSRVERRGALVVNQFDGAQDEAGLCEKMIPHSVVFVDNKYLVDTGFGGNSLRGPLPFRGVEEEVSFHGETYRFKRCEGFVHYSLSRLADWWGVMVKVEARWLELWRFPANILLDRAGLEQMNRDLFFAPQVVNIRDNYLLVGRVTPTKRVFAYGKKAEENPLLKTIEIMPNGSTQQSTVSIASLSALKDILKNEFNFSLPPENVQEILYFEGNDFVDNVAGK